MTKTLRCNTHVLADATLPSDHVNAMPFTGTLLLLDEPSDQPPHGADAHPILVTKEVAEKNLSSLVNMGVNVANDMEGHDPQNKVGVIKEAWIDGNKVRVKGVIWKKDFPEVADDLKKNDGKLGMSMELGNVYVRDQDEPVWHLQDFHFTGATILKKDHAAYERTDMAASKHFVLALAAARDARKTLRAANKNIRTERLAKAVEIAANRSLGSLGRR